MKHAVMCKEIWDLWFYIWCRIHNDLPDSDGATRVRVWKPDNNKFKFTISIYRDAILKVYIPYFINILNYKYIYKEQDICFHLLVCTQLSRLIITAEMLFKICAQIHYIPDGDAVGGNVVVSKKGIKCFFFLLSNTVDSGQQKKKTNLMS